MRNLTELSLKNRPLVWYFIIVAIIGGQRDVASGWASRFELSITSEPVIKNFRAGELMCAT